MAVHEDKAIEWQPSETRHLTQCAASLGPEPKASFPDPEIAKAHCDGKHAGGLVWADPPGLVTPAGLLCAGLQTSSGRIPSSETSRGKPTMAARTFRKLTPMDCCCPHDDGHFVPDVTNMK